MTIEQLYEHTVLEIKEIDEKIKELQGQRYAYNDIRSCLYSMIEDKNRVQEGESITEWYERHFIKDKAEREDKK